MQGLWNYGDYGSYSIGASTRTLKDPQHNLATTFGGKQETRTTEGGKNQENILGFPLLTRLSILSFVIKYIFLSSWMYQNYAFARTLEAVAIRLEILDFW